MGRKMKPDFEAVKSLLNEAVSLRIGSGMAAAFGTLDSVNTAARIYVGQESHFGASVVCPRTIFDLASLTKILATTSLYMCWHDQGRIHLDEYYPGKSFTFRQLLNHTSGLPAWKPFYENLIAHFLGDDLVLNPGSAVGANQVKNISPSAATALMAIPVNERKSYMESLVLAEVPQSTPGEKVVYSDLGFLLLAFHAERITGSSFASLVKDEVWSRIPGCGLSYRELQHRQNVSSGIAATEWCPWRSLLQGEVHDDNAWSMGGVAGHAGVFGTLEDVIAWVRAMATGQMVSWRTLREFAKPIMDLSGNRRALGFDFSSHAAFSASTIGHLGFTGTSVWMDLDQGRFAILLTNRVHPSREDIRIRDFRQAFHQSLLGLQNGS
jgi:serine-type D-Ala-D-Ala carboxypeptidase